MKISKSITKFVFSTLAGIGIASLLLPQPSWGQNTTNVNSLPNPVNPLQDFEPQQNSDPFSRAASEGDAYGGIFDLIHRAQQGSIRSLNDYASEQNQSLDAAAAQFRTRQLEKMKGQNQVRPGNSNSLPQPSK